MATYIPQRAEDTVAATGELGVPVLGVSNEAASAKHAANDDYGMVALDSVGRVGVTDLGGSLTVDIGTGTNNIGDVDVLTIAAGSNAIGNIGIIPRTTGGLTTFHLVSAGTTNATNVKASVGQLFGWYIYNSNAAARKVAFHNTSGTPTAGSSIYFTLVIPASSGANVFNEIGIAFSSGIGITTVTGLADSDSVAVAANDLIINLWYA